MAVSDKARASAHSILLSDCLTATASAIAAVKAKMVCVFDTRCAGT